MSAPARPQRVRIPLRVITSTFYGDATVPVYAKIAALASRREGCTAGVAYLSGLLGLSRSTIERALTQLTRPSPDDDVIEVTTVRRTLPGGTGTTAVRRVRLTTARERFVWIPARAPDALSPRQLRAYAAVAFAVETGHPLSYGELGNVLRHRGGGRAGEPLDDRSVAGILDDLEALGWLSIERRAGRGGRHLYTVHDQPFFQPELPADLDGGSGPDLGGGSLAAKEDSRTDSLDAEPGGSIRRRRGTGSEGVDNPTFASGPAGGGRPYAGPRLTLAPRIWTVLIPVAPLLPGLPTFVVRKLAQAVGEQLDQGVEPERIRGRLQHRYASTKTIRDPGRWLLGAAVVRHGCGLAACESGRIWRTGARCEVCADLRSSRPDDTSSAARPPIPGPGGAHPYRPDRRGACADCDLPAANARHLLEVR